MEADLKTFLTVSFGFLAFVNVIGNVMICVVVKKVRSLHIPMFYLLVNLCVANVIMAIFSSVMYVFSHFFLHPSGNVGKYLCKFITGEASFWIAGFTSGFSLAVIAYERYRVVVNPYNISRRLNSKRLKTILVICWVSAILLNIPHIYSSNVRQLDKQNIICWEEWQGSVEGKVWSIVLVFITFLIPLTIIIILYSKTVYYLFRGQRRIVDTSQMAVAKVRKRITVNLLLMTVLFALCWTLDDATYIYMQFNNAKEMETVRQFAIFLVCVNSAVHPFIMASTSHEIKRGIKTLASRKKKIILPDTGGFKRRSRHIDYTNNPSGWVTGN